MENQPPFTKTSKVSPARWTLRSIIAIGIAVLVVLLVSLGALYYWYQSKHALTTVAKLQLPSHLTPRHITVWIHGTRGTELVPVHLWNKTAKVEQELCFCPPGLQQSTTLDTKYHMHTIGKVLCESCIDLFPQDSFYIYGWSGALSFSERKEAAHLLFHALEKIFDDHTQKDGIEPHITVITHSHGGNVALNLAAMISEEHHELYRKSHKTPLFIERLILLACPVQKETAHLVSSPLFKHVYSLHSHLDALQILDPQGIHALMDCSAEAWKQWSWEPIRDLLFGQKNRPVFSERHFEPCEKLKQVRLRWQETHPWSPEDIAIFSEFHTLIEGFIIPYASCQRDLLHIEFMLPSFLRRLPDIIKKLEAAAQSDIDSRQETSPSSTKTHVEEDGVDTIFYL